MTDSMVRKVLLILMVLCVAACADRIDREKRQVTYHRDEHHEISDEDDDDSIQPVTKKPLPTQVVYPGDLSSFYTTDSPPEPPSNHTSTNLQSDIDSQKLKSIQRRSIHNRRRADVDREGPRSSTRGVKSSRNKDMTSQESRLHASYHKPSVSIMNDVPVEMSFDGAGFLRHEDEDSSEQKDSEYSKPKKTRGRAAKSDHDNNRALDDFRKVFNLTRDRVPDQVKFDDDAPYQHEPTQYKSTPEVTPEKVTDYGTQAAENNGSPFAIDFMTSYQNAYQNQFQNPYQTGMMGNTPFNYMPSQTVSTQQNPSYDPFTFNFPSIFNAPQSSINPSMNPMQGFNSMQNVNSMQNANQIPNITPMPNMNQMQVANQMRDSGSQHESYMQNHRMPSMANPASVNPIYQNIPQQNFNPNPVYQSNVNTHAPTKTQRRKRSVPSLKNTETDTVPSASEANEDHYRRSQSSDQQDASSGFIPITGNFNGGSIQLAFPFYGQSPMSPPTYSNRPVQPVPLYSMPIHPESRQYGGMERYYHPSEARRYSYGVLGSGNFEVIRGGLFPGERQQSFNGYQDGRIPYGGDYGNHGGGYGNQGNEYGNFGTTEIIIDGPIQGFQGFDNFPAHLINALSKHSEISLRPNHRESEIH